MSRLFYFRDFRAGVSTSLTNSDDPNADLVTIFGYPETRLLL